MCDDDHADPAPAPAHSQSRAPVCVEVNAQCEHGGHTCTLYSELIERGFPPEELPRRRRGAEEAAPLQAHKSPDAAPAGATPPPRTTPGPTRGQPPVVVRNLSTPTVNIPPPAHH